MSEYFNRHSISECDLAKITGEINLKIMYDAINN